MSDEATSEKKDESFITHELRKAILSIEGEPIKEIKFREPRAGDIVRCGNPVKTVPFAENPDITFDGPSMTKMMAQLSGVPALQIEKMNTQDWIECAWGIAHFFVPWLSRTS